MIRKLFMAPVLIVAMLFGTTNAHAWTKVKNNTPNTVSVAYTHIAIGGVGCGYWTCRSGNSNGHRVQGWWVIAPGGTATVNSNAHHNATRHGLWAFDQFGHVWGGGGLNFGVIFPGPFDYCWRAPFPAPSWWGPAGSIQEEFFDVPVSTCCGFWCSGVDKTQGLIL